MHQPGRNKRRLFFICFYGFFLICAALFTRIKYHESVLLMTPRGIQNEVKLFEAAPLTKKLFIVVEAADAADLPEVVSTAENYLRALPLLKPAHAPDKNFLLSFYYSLPQLWDEELQSRAAALLAPDTVEEKLQNDIAALMGPQGGFMQDFITADPLGLLGLLTPRLAALNITGGALGFAGGYLASPDGKTALLIYDAADNFDRAQAFALDAEINKINAALGAEGRDSGPARVFAMGAARYTQENNRIITADVKRVLAVSVLLMAAVFLLFFRRKNALLIYAVPLLVFAPAAVFTAFVYGGLSGITLGFGSVLMGLAVDYTIYIYFAMKASPRTAATSAVLRKMAAPICVSALTSVMAFAGLYFSGIPLLGQIGVFAVCGLLYAFFIGFAAAPLIFKKQNSPERGFKLPERGRPLPCALIIAVLLAGGFLCARHLKFDASLDSLNTVSAQFTKDRAAFDALTGNAQQNGSLLFIFGADREEALENSLAFARETGVNLPLNKLLVPAAAARASKARWHVFWTVEKINKLKTQISAAARRYGLKPEAFDGFYAFLETGAPPAAAKPFDLTAIYNPFASYDGRAAAVHILPAAQDITLPAQFAGRAALISQNLLREELFVSVIKTLAAVTACVFAADFLLLLFALRSAKLALLAFIPIACAVSVIIIISALFGVRINLFSLFSLPLIIGLGADYAVFIIHQKTRADGDLYPSRAVAAAALLTLAGFGALIFAEHKALFAMGYTITIGISAAGFVSIWLLPALLKNCKKMLPLLLLCFLLGGCAGMQKSKADVLYNVPAPQAAPAENARQYYGDIENAMFFTALAAGDRLVVLNEIGIKMADFTLNPRRIEVHDYLRPLPRRAVSYMGRFFWNFYYNPAALVKTAEDGKILYKSKDGRIKLYDDN
ncbi:MAG: MMPL family transporter [Elusimicrobiota bacterium]|jgi:predicted exporter|nr:MMPL family transporter [Elusimicrobiota bacterium]